MQTKTVEIEVGKLNDIPPKTGKTIHLPDRSIALFHLSNGDVRAMENRCPHRGGPLAEGMISGEHVFCPLHNWKINTKDGQVQKPDDGCVKTFPVDIIDDYIYIHLD